MGRKKLNPLVKLAKINPQEVDKFAEKYDQNADKEHTIQQLGDLMKLRKTNLALYANITNALGINQQVEEDAELHITLHHSNQNGKDHSTDHDRTHALVLFLIQTYVDVSRNWLVNFIFSKLNAENFSGILSI